MKRLVKEGIDEIAVFIYSPIPGSFFADKLGGFRHYSELSRSPTWKKIIKKLTIIDTKCIYYFSYIK